MLRLAVAALVVAALAAPVGGEGPDYCVSFGPGTPPVEVKPENCRPEALPDDLVGPPPAPGR